MNVSSMSALTTGALVFWDPGTTMYSSLAPRLDKLGLSQFCPARRSAGDALKRAMSDYGNEVLRRHGLHKRQADDNGKFRVSVEIKSHLDREKDGYEMGYYEHREHENEYDPQFSAKVDSLDNIIVTKGDAPAAQLQESFNRYRAEIPGSAVGQSLVAMLKHFHGTCVRDVGGVYYLPDDCVDQWDDICEAYEASSAETKISRVRIILDERSAMTVRRAITNELATEAGKIAEEFRNAQLGDKAIENRIAKCNELRTKALKYQQILQQELTEAMGIINVASTALAANTAVQQDDEVFDEMFS